MIERIDQYHGRATHRLYANSSDPIEKAIGRRCIVCKELKLKSEFAIARKNKDGMQTQCRPCNSKQTSANHKKRRNSNPEYRQQWNEKTLIRQKTKYHTDQEFREQKQMQTRLNISRRNAIAKGAQDQGYTEQHWLDALDYFDGQRALSATTEDLHFEHFIAPANGGNHGPRNIAPISGPINSSKSQHNPLIWILTQPADIQARFNDLLEYLAMLNQLSVEEYTDYVDIMHWIAEANTNVS